MILKSKSFMHSENLKTEFLNRKNKLMQSLSNFNENHLVLVDESNKWERMTQLIAQSPGSKTVGPSKARSIQNTRRIARGSGM